MLIIEKIKVSEFPNKQDILSYLCTNQEDVLNSKYNPDSKLKFICPSCGVNHFKSLRTILKGKGAYCKDCSRLHILADDRQLYNLYPVVAKMFDNGNNLEKYSGRVLTSKQVSYGSNKSYLFRCRYGHRFNSTISDVVRSYNEGSKFVGCPYCAGVNKSLLPSIKDVIINAEDWWDEEKNKSKVEEVVYQKYSHTKYAWKCPSSKHSFYRSLDKIKDNQLTCPICSGRKFVSGVNDIKSLVPQIAMYFDEEKNGMKVSEAFWSDKSEKDYWWKCQKGHSFIRKPTNINVNNFTCAVCQGKQVNIGVNDLQTLRPDILPYWVVDNDIKPWEVTVDSGNIVSFNCVQCGDIYDTSITSRTRSRGLCPQCNKIYTSSMGEEEVGQFLNSLRIGYEAQAHIFENKSKACDFYIPKKNLVVEYNGIYWHSEKGGKDKSYHYKRYKELESLGISLVTIWEDDWVSKRDLIERILKRKLGVSSELKLNARDCSIYQELHEDLEEVRSFLDKNHIQGFKSGSLYLSLRDEKLNIVGIMVLQKKSDTLYEIVRYATSCILRGGFSKILSVLKEHFGILEVQTFSDNMISDGGLYHSLGFNLIEELKPDYCYVYQDKRIHKFNFRKDSFEKRELLYKENLSESELASLNGIARIWDAGKKKWMKIL